MTAALGWLAATERAADRVGMVVTGDLAGCVKILERDVGEATRASDLVWASVTEDVLGDNGTIQRTNQLRYLPQKMNSPTGTEMTGNAKAVPHEHMLNFFDCVRTGKEPNCPFDLGYRVAIACRMAVDSYRFNRTMRWDAKKEDFT